MAQKIGSQDGITAAVNRLRDLDPGGTLLVKSGGKWPDISTLPSDLSTWKAYDKLQRTLQILKNDHDQVAPPDPSPEPPPDGGNGSAADLDSVRARIFLANDPLDCLSAPEWMVPVCTADLGYRHYYDSSTIKKLRDRFGAVESWCDCRNPTAYSEAVGMCSALGLDSAWGQCETQPEYDHAYHFGSRRMVGNLSALNSQSLDRIRSAEVLVSVELYRNVQPWMLPDWMGCNAGVGGNTIACYASETEGAVYTPVSKYKADGLYVSGQDSVYGVGLKSDDWHSL